jgi:16S rRNA G966 N2-methylase RsmD
VNALYYGENPWILREHIARESVDLIYLDPPFNSNANYNVLFKESRRREVPRADRSLRRHVALDGRSGAGVR